VFRVPSGSEVSRSPCLESQVHVRTPSAPSASWLLAPSKKFGTAAPTVAAASWSAGSFVQLGNALALTNVGSSESRRRKRVVVTAAERGCKHMRATGAP